MCIRDSLKDMGCNAIRTYHNMPAPELVEACDEMGMMLMVESFDEWKSAKIDVYKRQEHSIPAWHGGKGNPAFLFVDEISLN